MASSTRSQRRYVQTPVREDLRIRCEALAAWSVVDFAPLACAARASECLCLASARGWPDCPRRMQWAGPRVHQLRDALYSRNTHSREYSATTCGASAPHQHSVSRGRGRNGSSMHSTTPSDGQACAGASALLQGRLGALTRCTPDCVVTRPLPTSHIAFVTSHS